MKHPDIDRHVEYISTWLAKFGYTLNCTVESLPNGQVGNYESGSVFEKEIQICVSTDNIRVFIEEMNLPQNEYDIQCELTVYHEVGHALMEQLIDWSENIDEMEELLDGYYGKKYFDIFNDDNKTEEQIVEEFAEGMYSTDGSLLQSCFEETDKKLSNS